MVPNYSSMWLLIPRVSFQPLDRSHFLKLTLQLPFEPNNLYLSPTGKVGKRSFSYYVAVFVCSLSGSYQLKHL